MLDFQFMAVTGLKTLQLVNSQAINIIMFVQAYQSQSLKELITELADQVSEVYAGICYV